jgi:metal-responsive CopG/Arc/MetJ family transcriptional regulator
MKAIQILMDDELIEAVDQEAKRRQLDRSKVIRTALLRLLAESRKHALEQQHIEGYRKHPVQKREIKAWERVQEWPEK